jgi:hypothetical protein
MHLAPQAQNTPNSIYSSYQSTSYLHPQQQQLFGTQAADAYDVGPMLQQSPRAANF